MVLYHGSTKNNLSLLKPRPTLSHDKLIGDFLFATKNFKLALMYLTPKGIAILMEPDDDPNIVICSSEKSFKKKDKGGTIYELPSKTFIESPQAELSNYEMVSEAAVKPTNKTIYKSTFKAMRDAGIKVRFVDEPTFKKLIRHPKQKELIAELPLFKE